MFVLAFFRELAPALHLAVSDDGFAWSELNGQEPVLESRVGAMYWRDPFIMQDLSGTFHLLCTDGWSSPDIIHATSKDLLAWSSQQVLHVMAAYPTARNAWAPEACLDPATGEIAVFWSSTVPAAFPEHAAIVAANPKEYRNHRIYGCKTRDFAAFTPTSVFFDPGYNCIDASIARGKDGTYLMAFKDERGNDPCFPGELARKHVLVATAGSLDGPWTVQPGPVSASTFNGHVQNDVRTWAEGPCVTWNRQREAWVVCYEYFRAGKYGAATSKDGTRWERIDERCSFPPGAKHGTVFEVQDPAIIEGLESIRAPIDD